MQTLKHMKQFMEPQSVALIGTSRDTGEGTFNLLENLLSYGYQGKVYPINPSASEILGIKTYSTITDVTEDIDLAVITTPRSIVPSLVKECADRDIKAITIVAQGFADASDDQGQQLQRELDNIVESSQSRIIGPNTFGTANAFINFSSSFIRLEMNKQPVGVICQTGVFFVGFSEVTLIGKGIDLGNACDVSFAEGLEYFENDPEINVVALHVEGMRNAREFINMARRVAQVKPILTLKTGRSEQASKSVQSHTGSLTGNHQVWEAALKQAGVIQAGDLEEFLDLTRAFSVLPLMKNAKVGVITLTGGLGIITIDGSQHSNLEISKLSSETKKRLEEISPSWLNVTNPVDIWPAMMTSQSVTGPLADGLETLLSDKQLAAVLLIGAAFNETWRTMNCQLVAELAAAYRDKPLVCCLYGPYSGEAINEIQNAGKIAGFPTPERAIRALSRLNEYSQLRGRL